MFALFSFSFLFIPFIFMSWLYVTKSHAMTQNHIYCKTFWNIEKVHRAKKWFFQLISCCSFPIFFRLLILILRFIQFYFWHFLSLRFRCQSSREGNLDSADMESNSSKNSRDYWSNQQVNIMTLYRKFRIENIKIFYNT